MNILLEAVRELKVIDEDFKELDSHFNDHVYSGPIWQIGQKFDQIKHSDHPQEVFYIGLSKPEYMKEARELSNEDFADAAKTTTVSGTIGFKGKPTEEWKDCFYIIRNPSKFINKKYFLEKYPPEIAEALWEEFTKHAGTDEFVDVCVTKGEDGYQNTSDKSILTFYPSDKGKIERLKYSCFEYYGGQIDEAKKDQCLIVIPTYYVRDDDLGLRGYVVKPTAVSESQIDRGHRGLDNMVSYKKGIYTDKKCEKIFSFDTKAETSTLKNNEGDNYALSSRYILLAKHTFEKAACKSIFNNLEKRTTFRQAYIENAICKWFSDIVGVWDFLKNEPEIQELVKSRFGIDAKENYSDFKTKIDSLYFNLRSQWYKLEDTDK